MLPKFVTVEFVRDGRVVREDYGVFTTAEQLAAWIEYTDTHRSFAERKVRKEDTGPDGHAYAVLTIRNMCPMPEPEKPASARRSRAPRPRKVVEAAS